MAYCCKQFGEYTGVPTYREVNAIVYGVPALGKTFSPQIDTGIIIKKNQLQIIGEYCITNRTSTTEFIIRSSYVRLYMPNNAPYNAWWQTGQNDPDHQVAAIEQGVWYRDNLIANNGSAKDVRTNLGTGVDETWEWTYNGKITEDSSSIKILNLGTTNDTFKFGKWKIYLGGELVRDYIPCVLNVNTKDWQNIVRSAGTAGFWDLVTNQFFSNISIGAPYTAE